MSPRTAAPVEIPFRGRGGERLALGRRHGDNYPELYFWDERCGWRPISPANRPEIVVMTVAALSARLRRQIPADLLAWLVAPRPEHPWQGFEDERWIAVAVEAAEAVAAGANRPRATP